MTCGRMATEVGKEDRPAQHRADHQRTGGDDLDAFLPTGAAQPATIAARSGRIR
jgi:hypothetical protein